MINDREAVVRNQVGDLMNEILNIDQESKLKNFNFLKDNLSKNIEETLNRETENAIYTSIQFSQKEELQMPEYEGWRSLESSLKSLQSIIESM